jgi:hypothetical protein
MENGRERDASGVHLIVVVPPEVGIGGASISTAATRTAAAESTTLEMSDVSDCQLAMRERVPELEN